MKIFEIKNGVYNIQQFKEVNDPNYVGTMFVEDGYKVFFLVFDKRYPEDDSILVEADKFSEFKSNGMKYYFGYPFAGCKDSGCNTPKERINSLIHTHFTSHDYKNDIYAN